MVVGFQQQLQRGRPGRILRDHQLQVVARRLPLAALGVERAQPLPDVEQVAARVRRRQAEDLLQPLDGARQVAAPAREVGQRLSRTQALRVEDRELAVQRLGLARVAHAIGEQGPALHEQLARHDVGGVGRRLEHRVELARPRPVLRPVADVRQ